MRTSLSPQICGRPGSRGSTTTHPLSSTRRPPVRCIGGSAGSCPHRSATPPSRGGRSTTRRCLTTSMRWILPASTPKSASASHEIPSLLRTGLRDLEHIVSIRESDMTFARQLAAYASSFKFDGVSDEAIDAAKVVLLDTLGCALGAIGCDAAAILEATVMDTGGLPEATIFGSGIRTNVLNALLVNGALVRYLEGHDNYLVVKPTGVTGCHPSDTIAMILALAERQGATGRDVLATIVLAYQLYGRLAHCEVSPLASKGWTPDGKAPLVTPLIAGKLLQLSEAQMERAVGISGSHGFPLGILDTDGEELTMTRNIRFARVAYQGVLAAYQAARGFTGVRRVVEGNRGWAEVVMHGDFDANLLELDPAKVGYVVASPQIRQFCADGPQAGFLDATHRLVIDHDLRASDIAHVTLRATPRCVTHCGGPEKRDPRT